MYRPKFRENRKAQKCAGESPEKCAGKSSRLLASERKTLLKGPNTPIQPFKACRWVPQSPQPMAASLLADGFRNLLSNLNPSTVETLLKERFFLFRAFPTLGKK